MSQLVIPGTNTVSTYDEALTGDYISAGGMLPLEKEFLEGVPHVITSYTFWIPQKGNGMVSVEAIVAGEALLNRQVARGRIKTLSVEPNERVLYNDGSTGIRRSLVQLGQAMGILNVGHDSGKGVMPEEGKLGESRYDLPWTQWKSFSQTTEQGKNSNDEPNLVPCFTEMNGKPLRIRVLGGLRRSEYSNEQGDSTTWYLG